MPHRRSRARSDLAVSVGTMHLLPVRSREEHESSTLASARVYQLLERDERAQPEQFHSRARNERNTYSSDEDAEEEGP